MSPEQIPDWPADPSDTSDYPAPEGYPEPTSQTAEGK